MDTTKFNLFGNYHSYLHISRWIFCFRSKKHVYKQRQVHVYRLKLVFGLFFNTFFGQIQKLPNDYTA